MPPRVQVHKGMTLFPALHLLVIEPMEDSEMASLLNEHITTLYILLYQDFVFSRDYEKSLIESSCRCAQIISLCLKVKEIAVPLLLNDWALLCNSLKGFGRGWVP